MGLSLIGGTPKIAPFGLPALDFSVLAILSGEGIHQTTRILGTRRMPKKD